MSALLEELKKAGVAVTVPCDTFHVGTLNLEHRRLTLVMRYGALGYTYTPDRAQLEELERFIRSYL